MDMATGPDPVESIVFIEPFGQFPQNDNLVFLFQGLIDKVREGRRDFLVSGMKKEPDYHKRDYRIDVFCTRVSIETERKEECKEDRDVSKRLCPPEPPL